MNYSLENYWKSIYKKRINNKYEIQSIQSKEIIEWHSKYIELHIANQFKNFKPRVLDIGCCSGYLTNLFCDFSVFFFIPMPLTSNCGKYFFITFISLRIRASLAISVWDICTTDFFTIFYSFLFLEKTIVPINIINPSPNSFIKFFIS